ncbi:MAG: hypothetical protein AAGM22_22815 [Acidobacteriota bacterium]
MRAFVRFLAILAVLCLVAAPIYASPSSGYTVDSVVEIIVEALADLFSGVDDQNGPVQANDPDQNEDEGDGLPGMGPFIDPGG